MNAFISFLFCLFFLTQIQSVAAAQSNFSADAQSSPEITYDDKTSERLNPKSKQCKLPKEETLTIGCTYHCSKWVRWGIYNRAKRLGYKVKIVNLYSPNTTPDLSKVDALLIPGGADINPEYYLPHVEEELQNKIRSLDHLVGYTKEGEKRDPFEFALLEQYFANPKLSKLPILGICRGMQALAVSQKIPLIVDIKEEIGIRNRRWTLDRINITNPESVLSESLRRNKFWGVEYHHQALRLDYFNKHKERWPHLEVTALSNGGKIPEALEFYDRPVLGTQFHPEWTFGNTRRGVFAWLLNRACHKKVDQK